MRPEYGQLCAKPPGKALDDHPSIAATGNTGNTGNTGQRPPLAIQNVKLIIGDTQVVDRYFRASGKPVATFADPSGSACLAGLTAAVQAGLGVTALSERTAPPEVIYKGAGLPRLANVSVGLYVGEGRSNVTVRLVNIIVAALDKVHGA